MEQKSYMLKKKTNMLQVIENGKVVDNINIMADTIGSIAEQTNSLGTKCSYRSSESWRTR